MRTFITVEEARQAVLEPLGVLPAETVALADAHGRTLAEDAVSDVDAPPFDNSAMDGYAVRGADLQRAGAELRVTGGVRAGEWPTGTVDPGCCWRITTGAPVPPGADTVVPVEQTEEAGPDRVRVLVDSPVGRHVRAAGRDLRTGDRVVAAGTVVSPAVAGILAMVGRARVEVRRPPTVAIITTGDELVAPDRMPGPGQIRDSNGAALAAQAAAAGGRTAVVRHAPDDPEATAEALEQARRCDVIVFSGGVSMGSHDIVRGILEHAGMEPLFWKVRQRPGKPLSFGLLDGKPVFGLPGNPVSSAVCFDQYVRPALAVLLGRQDVWRPRHPAVLDERIPKPPGLHVFARGITTVGADGRLHVRPTGPQGSNLFTSVLRANSLVHLPAGLDGAEAGQTVEIEWLTW